MPGVERQMLTCCGYKFGSSRFIFFTLDKNQIGLKNVKPYLYLYSDHLTVSFFKTVEFKMVAVSVKKLYCQLNYVLCPNTHEFPLAQC